MTSEQLLEEGWRLARPCLYLDEEGDDDQVVALWGGPGIVPAPPGPFQHWLSLDCRFLPQNPAGLTGCLSLYTNEEDCESGLVLVNSALSLPSPVEQGIALFGRSGMSLPPIDAVVQVPAVRQWLQANHLEHDPPRGAYFDDEAYQATYQAQCPLYNEDAYAMLGGWHMPWPENDWQEHVQDTLLVWTFKDAEPWVEAWMDQNGAFQVIQRIT